MSHPFAPLVGTWETTGQIRASDDQQAVSVRGSDRYEWVVDDAVVLHRVDVHVGDEHVRSCEVIGPTATPGEYFMHAYDASGDAGRMTATVAGSRFTFQGPALRFSGALHDDGHRISGVWERRSLEGEPWMPWMDIQLTRRDAPAAA